MKGKMDMGVMNGGTYQIIQIWHLLMTKSQYGDHICGTLPSEITIKYIQNLYHRLVFNSACSSYKVFC